VRSSVVAHRWLPRRCIAVLEAGTRAAQLWSLRRNLDTYAILPAAPVAFSDCDSAIAAAVRGGGYVRVLCIETEQQVAAGLLLPVLMTGTMLRSLSPGSTHGIAMRATRSSHFAPWQASLKAERVADAYGRLGTLVDGSPGRIRKSVVSL